LVNYNFLMWQVTGSQSTWDW